jgi:hypothetical protein
MCLILLDEWTNMVYHNVSNSEATSWTSCVKNGVSLLHERDDRIKIFVPQMRRPGRHVPRYACQDLVKRTTGRTRMCHGDVHCIACRNGPDTTRCFKVCVILLDKHSTAGKVPQNFLGGSLEFVTNYKFRNLIYREIWRFLSKFDRMLNVSLVFQRLQPTLRVFCSTF